MLGEDDDAGHWKLGAVKAGERFAFQGRAFETADADGDGLIEVRPTSDVLGRVYQTHVRQSDAVIDLVITTLWESASNYRALVIEYSRSTTGPSTVTGTERRRAARAERDAAAVDEPRAPRT